MRRFDILRTGIFQQCCANDRVDPTRIYSRSTEQEGYTFVITHDLVNIAVETGVEDFLTTPCFQFVGNWADNIRYQSTDIN